MTDKYPVEKRELGELFRDSGSTHAQLNEWVDRTLDMHRAQAAAYAWKTEYRLPNWWSRNWFPVIMLVMMGGGMVLIGLVNGWS